MDERLRDYEKLGIDRQFLFPQFTSMLFSYLVDAPLATAMAHSWNVSILKLIREFPDRLIGGALVALQDVEASIQELQWAYDNGFGAVILDKVFPVKEHCYSEPLGNRRELWPFFKRAEELRMPVFLDNIQHGHRTTNMRTFQFNGLDVLAPQEGRMSLVSLVTSGLLDDFPRLNFVFTESGVSFVKPMVSQLDAVFEDNVVDYESEDAAPRFNYRRLTGERCIVSTEDYRAKNKRVPSEYFRTNIHFTIETEEPELADPVHTFGASQFLFATDYPHDDPGGRMKYKDVELFTANSAIDSSEKELIWYKNSERLLANAHR